MFIKLTLGLILLFVSISASSNQFEFATKDYQVYDAYNCYYKNQSEDIKGILNLAIPEIYKGMELQDTSGVVDGWAPAWQNCGSVLSQNRMISIGNFIPKVALSVYQDTSWQGGETRVVFSANASDYRGNIAWYEWTVNGVVQSNMNKTLVRSGANGEQYNVTVKVVDDGVISYNNDEGYYYNAGFPIFEQTASDSVTISVKPWVGCGRDCIIH